jgi:hypothetical protein
VLFRSSTIGEDVAAASNNGATVADIVVDGSISDPDGSAVEAIAVSAVDNSHGAWQYKVGGGAWAAFDFSGGNTGTALLLGSGDSIRFLPNANWNGTVSEGITFYAWDMSAGSAGNYLTVAGNTGADKPLSIASDTASITVTADNDAPVLNNAAPALANVNEDVAAGSNNGTTIAGIVVNGSITDVDYTPATGAPEAIAVSAVDNSHGAWQFKVGSGAWTAFDFGGGNAGCALLLDGSDSIRFLPDANWNGTVSNGLTFYAWDKSAGSAGNYLTVSGNTGADKPLSTASDTAAITVDATNDAPTRTAGSLATITVNEDSSNTTAVTLGLAAVTYGPGGGADEAGQSLTYTVTAIPAFMTLWKSDGVTRVTAGNTVSAAELQGLMYKTVADAHGTGNLTWTVVDDGGTAHGGLNTLTENLAITVNALADVTSVAIANGTRGGNTTYRAGDTVDVTVNFDQAVTVAGGTPTLDLDIGGNTRTARYATGSGSAALHFTYQIQADESDSDGIDATASGITLGTATIRDSSGDFGNATLTYALVSNANAKVDGVAPTVTDAHIGITSTGTGTGGVYKVGDTVTVQWNNTAGGDNNSDTISSVTVDFTAFGGGEAVAATNSAGAWTASYQLVAGSIDGSNKNISVTATDNAGNTKTTEIGRAHV